MTEDYYSTMGNILLDKIESVWRSIYGRILFVENPMWFECTMWDDKALREFKIHEEMNSGLQTTRFIGRMLRNCIAEKSKDFFGMVEDMDWKKPFILVDIIEHKFRRCGIQKCLRVQETPTWTTSGTSKQLKIWDLVIFPECIELAEHMTQRKSVKKTVCIWNAYVDRYPKPWLDDKVQVSGEIFLRPGQKHEKVLSVIIFHHEETAKCRQLRFTTPEFDANVEFKMYYNRVDYFECVTAKYHHKIRNEEVNEARKEKESTTKENAIKICEDIKESLIDTDDEEAVSDCSQDAIVIYETDQSDTESDAESVDLLREVDKEIHEIANKLVASSGVFKPVYN